MQESFAAFPWMRFVRTGKDVTVQTELLRKDFCGKIEG